MTVIIELNELIDLYYINRIFSTRCKSIQIFLKFILVMFPFQEKLMYLDGRCNVYLVDSTIVPCDVLNMHFQSDR